MYVLPLVCGWWLDICSLSLFGSIFKDKLSIFLSFPGTSMFLHWLVGMAYYYYFGLFMKLLNGIVRPGVLWFFPKLNDPDVDLTQVILKNIFK